MSKNLIEWSEKYSIGYDEIDDQHKKLVEMINELYNSFLKGEADKVAESIIQKMIEYTDYHFKTEEKYFEKYNYSDTELHIEQHKGFVDQVTNFFNEFKKGSVVISYDIMNFLRDWLVAHIQNSDTKFSAEFQAKDIVKL